MSEKSPRNLRRLVITQTPMKDNQLTLRSKIIIIIIIIIIIQTDHLISARRPDLLIFNMKKRTCRIVNLAVTAEYKVRKRKEV